MTPAHRARQAIVLSRFDLPGAEQLLVHSCEDCACPVSDQRATPLTGTLAAASSAAPAASGPWVSSRDALDIALDVEHRMLFNPAGHGGVVVVDEPAYRVFRSFARPADVRDARLAWPDGCDHVFRRLGDLELIHPVGHPPAPTFSGSQTLTAWLHVTNDCNLRCPYCYVSKSGEGMDSSTGRTAVEAVFRSAVAHGFSAVKLKYAGGEASLNHRLVTELQAQARALATESGLELQATLLSNGVKLPRALVTMLAAEGVRIMISLDGLGDQHDTQRPFPTGKPSFPLVERTIAELIEMGQPPHLSVTITNRNAAGVAEVVRFALERGLTFSLNFFRDNDCAASFPDMRYEEQTMISAMSDAFAVVEEFLPPWSVLGSILDRGQLLQPRERSCGVGQDYIVIDQRGQVAKCHMEIERTLGDVFGDDPLELVRRDTSTVLNLAVSEKEGCRDCTWRYWCSGGCAVATFRATGRYDIKSPNCNIYKAIYPQALRLEALRLLKYAPPVTGPGGERS
jgi:uncharacterized protein